MVGPADRRKHPRQRKLVNVIVQFRGKSIQATILDLGETGAYLATKVNLAVDDELLLRFRRQDDTVLVETTATVRHVIGQGHPMQAQQGCGVEFDERLSMMPPAGGESGTFPTVNRTKSAPARILTDTEQIALGPRESRHIHHLDVTFILHSGLQNEETGQIINVSRGGLFMATGVAMPHNTVFTVEFDGLTIDGRVKPLRMQAQVMWHSRENPGRNLPPGVGCSIIGFASKSGPKRWQSFLRALLTVGNPLFKMK